MDLLEFMIFGPEKYDPIYNRIDILLAKKVVLPMFFLIIMQK